MTPLFDTDTITVIPQLQGNKTAPKQKKSKPAPTAQLTGRAKNLALTGLFMSMAVSMISMTVVGTSMPLIIGELGGDQAAFTWVVTAAMLASAISTPIWGKLADLLSKKMMLQLSLIVFTVGSALSGLAADPGQLITFRVIQGLGIGGLGALGQIVLAEIISPRERGRYMGIMGAIMAVSTIGGPLLGGTITDTIGWRWNFYVAAPIAVAAIIMLQFTLHLPRVKKAVRIDYWGAVLMTLGFSALLIWITLGGSTIAWNSWQSYALIGGAVAALIALVIVELRVAEPLIPLTLFTNRTFTMSVIASLGVGVVMVGVSVFLGQYMQLARGKTPTESGLLTIPMMAGTLIASTIAGQLISRYGKWKSFMVCGSIVMAAGLLLLSQIRFDTSFWYVGVSMFLVGTGMGLCMQNLVLVVQNTVKPHQLGVASSGVTFFRTIAGTAGMSVLGSVLASQVADYMRTELGKLTPEQLVGGESLVGGSLPQVSTLSEPLRIAVETAYGHAVGNVFFWIVPLALLSIIAIAFLPNVPLSTLSNAQRAAKMSARTGALKTVTAAIPVTGPRTTPADAPDTASAAAATDASGNPAGVPGEAHPQGGDSRAR